MGILVQNDAAPSLKQANEEIPRTVDEFVDEIHHLRLRIELSKTICSAIEVERLAEALREESPKPKAGPLHEVTRGERATSIVPACDDFSANSRPFDSPPVKSKGPNNINRAERGPKENAIAASISELYDRLGGFIKE